MAWSHKVSRIIADLDRWLAVQVLTHKLTIDERKELARELRAYLGPLPDGCKEPTPQQHIPTPHNTLAEEAADWDAHHVTPAGFQDAPDAVVRSTEVQVVSFQIPNKLLAILQKFAQRAGSSYQTLIKRWLDDRIQAERERMLKPGDLESPHDGDE